MLCPTVSSNTDSEKAILRIIFLAGLRGGTTGSFIAGFVVIPWCFLVCHVICVYLVVEPLLTVVAIWMGGKNCLLQKSDLQRLIH